MKLKLRVFVKGEMVVQGTPDLETLQSFIFHYGEVEPLMVSTLKFDKAGREIFEGDVIKLRTYEKIVRYSDSKCGICLVNIEDLPYEHLWNIEQQPNEKWWEDFLPEIEVIGNIYQNYKHLNYADKL